MQGDDIHHHHHLMDLPTGFRFHPTDEEIITHYLMRKALDSTFHALAIAEVDMNKCEPWDLPKKPKMGEKENYFFCQRDRKYPTGMRTNRATESGYWKATGKDKEIYDKRQKNCLIGMRKTLVFYKGRAPKGEKTNWIMHDYRLEGRFSYYNLPKGPKDEWVVCRVFHKNVGINNRRSPSRDLDRADSFLDHLLNDDVDPSLPPLTDDVPSCSTDKLGSTIFSHGYEEESRGSGSESSSRKLQDQQINSFFMPAYIYGYKKSMETSSNSITHPNSSLYCRPWIPVTSNIRANYSNEIHRNSCFKVTPTPGYQQANSSTISAAIESVLQSNRQYCKVEPLSSSDNYNSVLSPSRDTGISYDMAPDISSIEKNTSCHEGLEGGSVDPNMYDLNSFWEYY